MGNSHHTLEPVDEDAKSRLGPRGIGDPNDFYLREKEIFVNIPRYQLQAAQLFKCKHLMEFHKECADSSYFPFISCSDEKTKYNDCVKHWAHDQEYRDVITIEYLNVREEYRKTGRRRLYRALKGETYVTEDKLYGFQG